MKQVTTKTKQNQKPCHIPLHASSFFSTGLSSGLLYFFFLTPILNMLVNPAVHVFKISCSLLAVDHVLCTHMYKHAHPIAITLPHVNTWLG